jgi:hypothetical protein
MCCFSVCCNEFNTLKGKETRSDPVVEMHSEIFCFITAVTLTSTVIREGNKMTMYSSKGHKKFTDRWSSLNKYWHVCECCSQNFAPRITDSLTQLFKGAKQRWKDITWVESPVPTSSSLARQTFVGPGLLRIVRHSSPFNAKLLQFFIPNILMSCHTHTPHLSLGLHTFLFLLV